MWPYLKLFQGMSDCCLQSNLPKSLPKGVAVEFTAWMLKKCFDAEKAKLQELLGFDRLLQDLMYKCVSFYVWFLSVARVMAFAVNPNSCWEKTHHIL